MTREPRANELGASPPNAAAPEAPALVAAKPVTASRKPTAGQRPDVDSPIRGGWPCRNCGFSRLQRSRPRLDCHPRYSSGWGHLVPDIVWSPHTGKGGGHDTEDRTTARREGGSRQTVRRDEAGADRLCRSVGRKVTAMGPRTDTFVR